MKTYLRAAVLAIAGLSPLAAHARVIGEADNIMGGKIVITDAECVTMAGIHTWQYFTFGVDGRATSAGCVTSKQGDPYIYGRGNYGAPVRWPKSGFTWHCDDRHKTC